jgi:hypothetical protein
MLTPTAHAHIMEVTDEMMNLRVPSVPAPTVAQKGVHGVSTRQSMTSWGMSGISKSLVR